MRRLWAVLLCAPWWVFVGCGEPKYYPVTGVVVDKDGVVLKELNGATVVFDAIGQSISAVGEIQADGSFSMSSEIADDGCVPGEHQVAIGTVFSDGDGPRVQILDPKYESTATSALKVTVQKGKNQIRLQVDRYRKPEAE